MANSINEHMKTRLLNRVTPRQGLVREAASLPLKPYEVRLQSGGKSRWSRTGLIVGILGSLQWCTASGGEERPVTITGGLRDDGSYRWVVTNHASTPVVSVELPGYEAEVFYPPPGWKSKSPNPKKMGAGDDPWMCRAWVDSPGNGIPQRGNATFGMRVPQLEVRQGLGIVKVAFANGTTIDVPDVEIPTAPGLVERFGVLIVFGMFFLLVVVIAARRRRKAAPTQDQ